MKIETEKILWWYVALLICATYILGLFIDLTGDSGLYAAITRQMTESGDWFHLQINGQPYDQKPHLLFWLAGLGIELFGNTNFGFKLFPALYGALGFFFTYRLGKSLFSKEAGLYAVLISATSQIFFLYFLDIHTDTILQTGVVLALWQLAEYLKNGKAIDFVFGFVGVGLAMLSKGPIGAVLPFFAVLLFLVAQRDFRQLFHPKWILGILIVVVIISPSLVHLFRSFGFEGLKFYFITNNVGRITGEYAGSNTEPFFYLYNFLWASLPWTVFLFASVFSEVKSWREKEERKSWSLPLLGSIFVFLVILSVARGKAPNYFLIVFPVFSVIGGKWISRFGVFPEKKQSVFAKIQMILNAAIGALTVVVLFCFAEGNFLFPIVLSIFLVVTVVLTLKLQSGLFRKTVLISLLLCSTLNFYLNSRVIPSLFDYQSWKQVLAVFDSEKEPHDKLYNFEIYENELYFYSGDGVENIKSWDKFYEVMADTTTWLFTDSIKYRDILDMKYELDTVYLIHHRGMNDISPGFLNPKTRNGNLRTNYLVRRK